MRGPDVVLISTFLTLCDDYIDRLRLTEQKTPFEYIVPPPSMWVGTKTYLSDLVRDY